MSDILNLRRRVLTWTVLLVLAICALYAIFAGTGVLAKQTVREVTLPQAGEAVQVELAAGSWRLVVEQEEALQCLDIVVAVEAEEVLESAADGPREFSLATPATVTVTARGDCTYPAAVELRRLGQ